MSLQNKNLKPWPRFHSIFTFIVIGLLNLSFISISQAHSEQNCVSKDLCLQINFESQPNSKDESVFDIQFSGANSEAVDQVAVDLWMPMGSGGHSSAPVDLVKIGNSVFQVSNAWFVMKGEWLIRIQFKNQNNQYQWNYPIQITE